MDGFAGDKITRQAQESFFKRYLLKALYFQMFTLFKSPPGKSL